MTAREELVHAVGEAILAEARKWPQQPGDRYGDRIAPMGATGDDLGRVVLAVVDAAGWRPPMTADPRVEQIRAVLDAYYDAETAHLGTEVNVVARISAIVDREPPAPGPGCYPPADGWDGVAAPRVFLPGDTVPKGVATVMPPRPDEDRAHPYVMHEAPWDYVLSAGQAAVELRLPSVEDVRAAIERAHAFLGGPTLTTDAELRALTPDQLEKCVHRALKARDVQAVEGYLLLMAPKDPGRAQYLMDTLKVGIRLAKEQQP